MSIKEINKLILKYILLSTILVIVIIYFNTLIDVASLLGRILTPLVIGFVIAYVVNIPMKKVESLYFPNTRNNMLNKSRRGISILISIIVILFIFISIINIVLPQIFNTFSVITSSFPEFSKELNTFIIKNKLNFPELSEHLQGLNFDWESILKNAVDGVTKGISNIFTSSVGIVSIIISRLFDFFMAVAFAIYLLFGKEKLFGQLNKLQKAFIQKEVAKKINKCLIVANESFTSFIIGQCTEAVILGTLCTIGMLIFKFPYATTIGIFIGSTALIPIVGAYLGAGVGMFLILMIDPIKALWFLVYILILQQLENNLIYPRIVGTSIGLPGIWVLVAIVIGGGLAGIIGMLLSVPISATLYKLLQMATQERINTLERVNNN